MVCKQCGECCKYIVFLVPHKLRDKEEMRYYEGRGIRFENVTHMLDREIIPCRCKYLTEDNKCSIWATRPDMCNRTKRDKNQSIWKPPGCTGED